MLSNSVPLFSINLVIPLSPQQHKLFCAYLIFARFLLVSCVSPYHQLSSKEFFGGEGASVVILLRQLFQKSFSLFEFC